MRKARTLGALLGTMLAVLGLGAVAASGDEFTAGEYPVQLTGEKDGTFTDEFITTSGAVKCAEPKYAGTLIAAADIRTASIEPEYSEAGCTALGWPGAIEASTCAYLFHINVEGTEGDVDLECDPGTELTVTANVGGTLKCTIHVPSQTDIGGTVKYINITKGRITVETNLTGIDYTHTSGTGVGACPAGAGTNGTSKAKIIVGGEQDKFEGTFVGLLVSA